MWRTSWGKWTLHGAEDYFAAIADDLTEEQAEASVAELRAPCTAVVGQ